MFSNLKVNHSDPGSDIISSRQGNNISGIKTGSSDFYSMVLNYSADLYGKSTAEKSYSSDRLYDRIRDDAARAGEQLRENRPPADEGIKADREAGDNGFSEKAVNSFDNGDRKPETEATVKREDRVSEKKGADENDEIKDFIQGTAGELISKQITELIQGGIKGDKEGFADNLRKIAEDLISSMKKKPDSGSEADLSMAGKKTGEHQNSTGAMLNDFLNKLENELLKIASDKKGTAKGSLITEKKLKETISAVINDIKKGKNRNHNKTEVRRFDAEEVKNDKRADNNTETLVLKRKDSGDNSTADFTSGKERNNSRDNSSFSAGRMDISGRSGLEKNDSVVKSPEFRQSLQEIIDKAKVSVKDSNNASFSVKLFPKELGSVNVSLLMENGVVSGRFLVGSDEARSLLMNSMENLMEQLAEAGIQLGDFNVNVNQGGERFASDNDDDNDAVAVLNGKLESETAVNQYDSNASAGHDGHINMVI